MQYGEFAIDPKSSAALYQGLRSPFKLASNAPSPRANVARGAYAEQRGIFDVVYISGSRGSNSSIWFSEVDERGGRLGLGRRRGPLPFWYFTGSQSLVVSFHL